MSLPVAEGKGREMSRRRAWSGLLLLVLQLPRQAGSGYRAQWCCNAQQHWPVSMSQNGEDLIAWIVTMSNRYCLSLYWNDVLHSSSCQLWRGCIPLTLAWMHTSYRMSGERTRAGVLLPVDLHCRYIQTTPDTWHPNFRKTTWGSRPSISNYSTTRC